MTGVVLSAAGIVKDGDSITEGGFIARFGEKDWAELTDGTGDGMPDDDFISQAVTDAQGVVVRHLAQRYRLPLPTMPADLQRHAHNVLRFILYRDQPTEAVTEGYKAALEWLQAVMVGDELLVGIDGTIIAPRSAARGNVATVRRSMVFGDEFERKYKNQLK